MRIIWLSFLLLTTLLLGGVDKSEGILQGKVGVLEGDCMPKKDQPPCKPRPVVASVLITKPSKSFQKEYLIDSVRSDANGDFEIRLKPGNYSTFIRYEGEIICTGFICRPECVCSPVTIKQDSTSVITLKIDKASW